MIWSTEAWGEKQRKFKGIEICFRVITKRRCHRIRHKAISVNNRERKKFLYG